MRHVHLLALLLPLSLVACVTHDPGWEGAGAEPFDAAREACEAAVAGEATEARQAAFEACMAGHGWSRPNAG